MKTGEKGKPNIQAYDLRVSDRQLAAGVFEHKTIERHLAELPDLEGQCENLAIEQPALGGVEPGRSGSGAGAT